MIATACGINVEPAIAWWVMYTLCMHDIMLSVYDRDNCNEVQVLNMHETDRMTGDRSGKMQLPLKW